MTRTYSTGCKARWAENRAQALRDAGIPTREADQRRSISHDLSAAGGPNWMLDPVPYTTKYRARDAETNAIVIRRGAVKALLREAAKRTPRQAPWRALGDL